MDTIIAYLNNLFLNVPNDEQKEQLQAELLTKMTERYHELIAEGKTENQAIGMTIAELGSIDDLLAKLPTSKEAPIQEGEELILEEEALNFIAAYRKIALGISGGVFLCCLSLAAFWGLFRSIPQLELSLVVLVIFVAAAVGCFISFGLKLSTITKKLDDRPISTQVVTTMKKLKENFAHAFNLYIVFGVMLCIASVAFLFLGDIGISLTLCTVGIGILLLIYGGMIQTSFNHFLKGKFFVADEDNLGPQAQREKYGDNTRVPRFFNEIFWPSVIIIYFLWSAIFGAWAISWIIWPIAGILSASINSLFRTK